MTGFVAIPVRRVSVDGTATTIQRDIVTETPIAIEINGTGYAVMMASPDDLDDFGHGFCLSERLADTVADIVAVDTHATDIGIILRITLAAALAERSLERIRHRVSDSACGLCGVENLEQALRPLPRVTATTMATENNVFSALAALRRHQPLNAATGAVHAAAACAPDGRILLVREDVGRHNAFDKLIGAMQRRRLEWNGGFALLTSRCSYELVEKAAIANCPMLVTVSLGTTLAVARAREAGIRLVMLARPDTLLVAVD